MSGNYWNAKAVRLPKYTLHQQPDHEKYQESSGQCISKRG